MDRKDLKIQALLEKISSLTTSYENQVADLRVDLTLVSNDKQELQQQVDNLTRELASLESANATQEDD